MDTTGGRPRVARPRPGYPTDVGDERMTEGAMGTPEQPVVAAVDGSEGSARAARWAAEEAGRRHALGQDLASEDRGRLVLHEDVQRL